MGSEESIAARLPTADLANEHVVLAIPPAVLHADQDPPLVVQCASGNRSMVAISVLKRQGIHNVIQLDGGITKWKMSGFEVTRDSGN